MKIIMRAIIITFVLMCGIAKAKADNTYTINATVINADNDVVTCEDVNGNIWEFYGDEFKVNDAIVLIMNANDTTTIYDDMIEDVQK
jgi:hypothetical protein